jgi:VanZ family protein
LLNFSQTNHEVVRQRERRIALLALGLTLVLLAMPGSVLAGVQAVMEPLISSLKAWKASWWPWPSSDEVGLELPVDKLVHFLLFVGCGYWVTRGWLGVYSWPGLLLALLAYGVLTEVIQVFVPGRGLSVGDMMADALGAAFGLIWALKNTRRDNRKELKQETGRA